MCLNALWVIVSGAGVLRICAEVHLSETEQCQFTVCTFCISIKGLIWKEGLTAGLDVQCCLLANLMARVLFDF